MEPEGFSGRCTGESVPTVDSPWHSPEEAVPGPSVFPSGEPGVSGAQRPAGSTHRSTRGLRPPEPLERQAEFPSSDKTRPDSPLPTLHQTRLKRLSSSNSSMAILEKTPDELGSRVP